ncbi:Kunitz/Bovine pancreatic trypsin inhibitor domain protein [Cooperia oncophora]
MDCHMPLDHGNGKNEDKCLANAGFRFYFDRDHGKCTRFWYLGCDGNANNFFSYEVCQRSCRTQMQRLERRPRANSNGTNSSLLSRNNPGRGDVSTIRSETSNTQK